MGIIPVAKGKGIPGDKMREQENTRFKTQANRASPNASSRKKGSTANWEIEKETNQKGDNAAKGDNAGYNDKK